MGSNQSKKIQLFILLSSLVWSALGCVAVAADKDTVDMPSVLWHNSSTGAVKIAPIKDMSSVGSVVIVESSNTNLVPKGITDFTEDDIPDILFHNQNSGMVLLWEMNGTTKIQNIQIMASSNTNLQVAGAGDFDGDGDNDIATFNSNSGSLVIWVMDGIVKTHNEVVLTGANLNLIPYFSDFD